MKIYQKIQFLRKQQGMSQEELADRLGVSRQSIYKWETGMSNPELDKFKKLTEIFGVSFEYLMNDELDEYVPETAPQTPQPQPPQSPKPAFRPPFRSKSSLSPSQAEIDHGYINTEMGKNRRSGTIFAEKKNEFEAAVRKKNYTQHFRIQADLLVEFFKDDKRKVFGFFWDGAEQFVCPYENLVSFSYTSSGPSSSLVPQSVYTGMFGKGGMAVGMGSVPTTRINSDAIFNVLISYYTAPQKTAVYTMSFMCPRQYIVLNNQGDSSNTFYALWDALSLQTKQNLNKINAIVTAAKASVANTEEPLPQLNSDALKKAATAAESAAFIRRMNITRIQKEEYSRNRKATVIKIAGIVAAAVAVIILLAVLLSNL